MFLCGGPHDAILERSSTIYYNVSSTLTYYYIIMNDKKRYYIVYYCVECKNSIEKGQKEEEKSNFNIYRKQWLSILFIYLIAFCQRFFFILLLPCVHTHTHTPKCIILLDNSVCIIR